MAEDKESTGISAARAGLGFLLGIAGSYLFPYYRIYGAAAWAARAVVSAAYTGLAAIVSNFSDEKTRAGTAATDFVTHFAGRTLGDHLRHYAWHYAPILIR